MRPKSSTPNLMLVVCTGLAVFSMSALWAQAVGAEIPCRTHWFRHRERNS